MREYLIEYKKDGRNCCEHFAVCSMNALIAEMENIEANGGKELKVTVWG